MSRINASSESVRAVATALERFVEEVEEAKNNLTRSVQEAREDWQDEKGETIEGEISELVSNVNVSEEAMRIAAEANAIADKIDEI